jgi:hypothetical protein
MKKIDPKDPSKSSKLETSKGAAEESRSSQRASGRLASRTASRTVSRVVPRKK